MTDAQTYRIHDRYYDTADGILRSAEWGLRTRQVNDRCLLALKGKSRTKDNGTVERTEIEGDWSLPVLRAVLEQLTLPGLPRGTVAAFDSTSPDATLARLGFEIIQDRETLRRARILTRDNAAAGRGDAELAVDRVVYLLDEFEIIHHEVEVEAIPPDGVALISLVHDDLMARFGESLRVWPHSKLAIGWALKKLIHAGRIQDLTNNRLLVPAAYDAVDEILAREAILYP